MLISDMVSMLAISRLIPTVTGRSEEKKTPQQHALQSLQSDNTANRERQQKKVLNLHALQEWTASTQARSVSTEFTFVLIAVVDDNRTLREGKDPLMQDNSLCKFKIVVLPKNGLRYLLYPFISF